MLYLQLVCAVYVDTQSESTAVDVSVRTEVEDSLAGPRRLPRFELLTLHVLQAPLVEDHAHHALQHTPHTLTVSTAQSSTIINSVSVTQTYPHARTQLPQ